MNNRRLFLFILILAFLAAFLGFWWFILRRPTTLVPLPLPSPTASPLPQIPLLQKQRVASELPYFGDGFTIEYFPKQDFFFVQITEPTYEEKEVLAKDWFHQRGLDPGGLNIEWGSRRGIAPTAP